MSGDATISNTGILSLVPTTSDGGQVQRQIRYSYDFIQWLGAQTLAQSTLMPYSPQMQSSQGLTHTLLPEETSLPIHATTGIVCGSASLQTAADETSQANGSFIEGDSTGTAVNFKKVGASPCTVQLTIGTGNLTAGKFLGFAEYVVIQ